MWDIYNSLRQDSTAYGNQLGSFKTILKMICCQRELNNQGGYRDACWEKGVGLERTVEEGIDKALPALKSQDCFIYEIIKQMR